MCISEAGGTDYVPVVSCLVQLALDSHSRTRHGFENLVEREWVALRHQFVERCALTASRDAEQVISTGWPIKIGPYLKACNSCI